MDIVLKGAFWRGVQGLDKSVNLTKSRASIHLATSPHACHLAAVLRWSKSSSRPTQASRPGQLWESAAPRRICRCSSPTVRPCSAAAASKAFTTAASSLRTMRWWVTTRPLQIVQRILGKSAITAMRHAPGHKNSSKTHAGIEPFAIYIFSPTTKDKVM